MKIYDLIYQQKEENNVNNNLYDGIFVSYWGIVAYYEVNRFSKGGRFVFVPSKFFYHLILFIFLIINIINISILNQLKKKQKFK